ncbi:D-alanyl-D-alanine carboxypeptidase, partial [uncultured Cardiobacterium sp.]|uniref:D-alanyl-D-alanine carboxypeptidase n=1 Tax=uncultured Cardiobacterium sp. TaxID=417619 RepID=UPI002602D8D5
MKLRTTAALLLCALSLNARALDFGGIPPEEISVYVKDLQSGRIIEEHRADESMNPASTMKLVTAFAAFRALGRDYRWTTELKSDGRVNGDTLEGDIYWVGSGDPMLDQDGLVALQQQLRDKGIVHINGRLVLDRSVWGETGSADDFGSDADEAFMTAPDPNMLAYKVVWVKPERGTAGGVDI